ncbi:hypothetical protein [Draconibacterium sediminis]|uniref:Uncharacterized protein n=1 Tax=Draconibacterium sediminis TaxID=1544798 RepID=A0A0D8JFQ3_9BACT|nr:hypothetical protein [Draconibacterium sediminis]KJF45391.1 hypothetical protein LH29_08490 [Draconibacterium sediminis]
MDIENKHIPDDAKYLARRVFHHHEIKLYSWQGSFYEVNTIYGTNSIWDIRRINNASTLDLYIEAMHRIGMPEPGGRDLYGTLNETGQIIAGILKADHLDFYYKLLWDEHLHWYCDMLEVRAAYLLDDILTGDMKVTEAREIAIKQLLTGDPERHIGEPYIQISDYNRAISFPWWFMNRKSEQNWLIEDEMPYGDGIRDVLCRLYEYGGWEDATAKEYWDEQTRKIEEIKRKRRIG